MVPCSRFAHRQTFKRPQVFDVTSAVEKGDDASAGLHSDRPASGEIRLVPDPLRQ